MGINGLLQLLNSTCIKSHIKKYANKRMGVDAYVWLHKGVYSCSRELCQKISTDKYIKYCLKLLNMLKHYKIIPVLIFDGNRLPMKDIKEKEREEKRKYNYDKAITFLRLGKIYQSDEYFRRAVDVTPQMAYNLIQVLKREKVEYIVSPYEADAQLAYLAKIGYIDGVITEDSDLIPYGTPRIMFKMDKNGNGDEFILRNISNNIGDFNFVGFTQMMIIRMCVIAGCDYTQGIKGIGIKTSYKYVKKYKTLDKERDVPESYLVEIERAENTFLYQRVWDPIKKKLTTVNPLPYNLKNEPLDYLGPIIDDNLGLQICTGLIDPITKRKFKNELNYSKIKSNGFYKSEVENEQKGDIEKYIKIKKNENSEKEVYRAFIPPDKKRKKKKKQKRILVRSRFFNHSDEEKDTEMENDEENDVFFSQNSDRSANFSQDSNFKPFLSQNSQKKINRQTKTRQNNSEEVDENQKEKSDFSDSSSDANLFDYQSFNRVSPFRSNMRNGEDYEEEEEEEEEEEDNDEKETIVEAEYDELNKEVDEILEEIKEKNLIDTPQSNNKNKVCFNYGDFYSISPAKNDEMLRNEVSVDLMNKIGKSDKDKNLSDDEIEKEEEKEVVEIEDDDEEIDKNDFLENIVIKKLKRKGKTKKELNNPYSNNRKRKRSENDERRQSKITTFFAGTGTGTCINKNKKKKLNRCKKKKSQPEIVEISDDSNEEEEEEDNYKKTFKKISVREFFGK